MLKRVKAIWGKLRANRFLSFAIDLAIFLPVLLGIMAWQERNMLPANGNTDAPVYSLTSLDGREFQLGRPTGKQTLVYFFAPWCGVCHASIDNVEDIRRKKRMNELDVYIVALDWSSRARVERFVAEHELTVPVLLGTEAVGQAYRVDAFPSYYVLDGDGKVIARSRGYSTEIGMRLRL